MPNIYPVYEFDPNVANRLKQFRQKHIAEMQKEACKILGVPQSTLSYMETGKAAVTIDFVKRLTNEYGLNAEWLTTGKGGMLSKETDKKNLVTDVIKLNEQLNLLGKQLKMMDATQNHLIRLVGRLETKIEQLEKGKS